MPCIDVPVNPILGNLEEYIVCWPSGASSGNVDIYLGSFGIKLGLLKSIPFTMNVSANSTVSIAQVTIQTTGGFGEQVIAWFASNFGNAFLYALRFLGYTGNAYIQSVQIQGNNIVVNASFTSPQAYLILIAIILAIVAIIALLIVIGVYVFGQQVVKPLAPGLNAFLVVCAIALAAGVGFVVYSAYKSPEVRSEIAKTTASGIRYTREKIAPAVSRGVSAVGKGISQVAKGISS
jgi:hypothetical protein